MCPYLPFRTSSARVHFKASSSQMALRHMPYSSMSVVEWSGTQLRLDGQLLPVSITDVIPIVEARILKTLAVSTPQHTVQFYTKLMEVCTYIHRQW